MQFLVCVECHESRILAPCGSTAATRFTCRQCAERLTHAANLEEAKRWRPVLTFVLGAERFADDAEALKPFPQRTPSHALGLAILPR